MSIRRTAFMPGKHTITDDSGGESQIWVDPDGSVVCKCCGDTLGLKVYQTKGLCRSCWNWSTGLGVGDTCRDCTWKAKGPRPRLMGTAIIGPSDVCAECGQHPDPEMTLRGRTLCQRDYLGIAAGAELDCFGARMQVREKNGAMRVETDAEVRARIEADEEMAKLTALRRSAALDDLVRLSEDAGGYPEIPSRVHDDALLDNYASILGTDIRRYDEDVSAYRSRLQNSLISTIAREVAVAGTIETQSPFLTHVAYAGCEWFAPNREPHPETDRICIEMGMISEEETRVTVACSCGASFDGVSPEGLSKARAMAEKKAAERKEAK